MVMNPKIYENNYNYYPFDLTTPEPNQRPGLVKGQRTPAILRDHPLHIDKAKSEEEKPKSADQK